jgi:hypothetical protein
MTEENEQPTEDVTTTSLTERLHLQDMNTAIWTIIFAVLGAAIYVGISLIPMPFMMVSVLKFGLLPAVTIIALTGAIRGPLAGFIAGYLGEVLYGLLVYNVVVTMTLPAMAYGIMGFIVGLSRYDFTNGRSLLKLAILSVIGFVFTTLLTVVLAITVEGYSVLAAIAFAMLPMLTMGLLTLLFLTPVLARLWYIFMNKISILAADEPAD